MATKYPFIGSYADHLKQEGISPTEISNEINKLEQCSKATGGWGLEEYGILAFSSMLGPIGLGMGTGIAQQL